MRRDVALALCAGAALAAPFEHEVHRLRGRNIVEEIKDSYDFVVVGGGLAGLVLGARLSEDAQHTVLVLEAGTTGDQYKERIDTPGFTYYQSLWPTEVNWGFKTVAQAGAGDRELVWPRGKVLGGSSAINGMYMNRPGQIEIEAWRSLIDGQDGADNWSWDTFYAALKKSETFTPPSDAMRREADIQWEPSHHGTSGPIHNSYPGYTFPQVGQWSAAMENLGLQVSKDTYGGNNWGAYVANSAINPQNWTRSYSRSGYLDPLPPRANYDVLANAHVTRVLFDDSATSDGLKANAVEYSRDGKTTLTVKVNKEVVLAAGTVGSPAVLLHSGVGPKDVLSSAGVPLKAELPGVGQHLQDHLAAAVQWSTDVPTAGSVYAGDGPEKTDPVFLSYINSATAYINATAIFGEQGAKDFVSGITAEINDWTSSVPSTDPTVIEGFKAIYKTTTSIIDSPIGQIELLLAINAAGAVRITAAHQHPLSTGRIYINSANPFDAPVIDPGYLKHGADVAVLREGLKLARKLGETEPLKGIMTAETAPGPDTQSNAAWETWMRGQIGTEFHPSSSCAMLPKALGGVVDANLRVYGLANVRVADASVPPIVFSAHLMASTYGLAEQASTLIRNFYNGGSTDGGSNGGNGGEDGGNAALALRPHWALVLVLVGALLL
ncbi:putative glucose-methanol-choline oxidoreductase [Auricularia subglabra TFB-10046 SS5]|nr:putative glucose-methanol-choline oxidoreductase [Auricularia subglabra TFB-10046 SS5]